MPATKPVFKVSFEEGSHFEPLRRVRGRLPPDGATRTVASAREQAGARATGALPRGLPMAKAAGLPGPKDEAVDVAGVEHNGTLAQRTVRRRELQQLVRRPKLLQRQVLARRAGVVAKLRFRRAQPRLLAGAPRLPDQARCRFHPGGCA